MKNQNKIKLFIKFISLILIALFCKGIAEANYPKQETPEIVITEPPSQDNYPKVIGLIAPEQDLYVKYFGEISEPARQIANCESGGDPSKHNYNPKTKDDSYGIFQINLWGNNRKTRPNAETLLIEEENIKFAKMIYDNAGGFSRDWVNCSRKLNIK